MPVTNPLPYTYDKQSPLIVLFLIVVNEMNNTYTYMRYMSVKWEIIYLRLLHYASWNTHGIRVT